MKNKLVLFLLFSGSFVFSQSISKSVIGSGGETNVVSGNKLSWTVGEPVVGLMTAGGVQLGNGYYPSLDLQTLSIQDNNLELQIKVYPNPTSEKLFVAHSEVATLSVLITDLNGKIIFDGIATKEVPLDVSSFSQGIYLVTVENKETNKKNTYKIIKK